MQQRRQDAAARLAESLRAQTALEQYRQSEVANQAAMREQAKSSAAATLLHQGQQQQNWTAEFGLKTKAEQRLEDAAKEASDFEAGPAKQVVDENGNIVPGYLSKPISRGREQLIKLAPSGNKTLTPTAALGGWKTLLSPESYPSSTNSPSYSSRTNALANINALLNPTVPSIPVLPSKARLKWNSEKGDFE